MERISVHQFMTLSAGVALGTTFFPVAQIVTKEAGRDGWWCVLPGFLVGIPFALLIMSLSTKFPGKNFIEISENIVGKWLGKGLGLIYVLVSIFFGSFLLAQVGDTFQRTIMPYVPIWVFLGSILILVAMLAWAGIEVFGRFTEIVWPVVLLSLIVTIIFLVQRFEWDQFYPILANGIKPITYGVWSCAPFGMEYVLFLAGVLSFLPREQENLKRLKTEVWRAIIMVGILDTLIALVQIMVFGPEESKRLNYGLLTLGKMVELGKALAGIESLFMLFWMGAMIIKIGAFYFTTLWGLRTVFGIKDELKWYLAISGIFLSLGYWAGKGPKFLEFITIMDQYIIFPFAIFWVSTIWGIAYWKQKRA